MNAKSVEFLLLKIIFSCCITNNMRERDKQLFKRVHTQLHFRVVLNSDLLRVMIQHLFFNFVSVVGVGVNFYIPFHILATNNKKTIFDIGRDFCISIWIVCSLQDLLPAIHSQDSQNPVQRNKWLYSKHMLCVSPDKKSDIH